jgi:hypothetical protein
MKMSKENAFKIVQTRITSIDSMLSRHSTQTHIAILIKRGKLLDIATNAIGSRSKGCGYSRSTIHAERAVLKKIGDLSKLSGAIMIVIRIAKGTHDIVNSEPCHGCKYHLEKCIKNYGLRCVYYSV